MTPPTSMTTSRLVVLTLLTVSGALASATAASVYAAGDPARRLPPSARVSGRIDPPSPALLAAAGDRTREDAERLSLLDQITNGACFSTREMLFGASPSRHEALDRAADAMAGVRGVAARRERQHAQLDSFSAGSPPRLESPASPGLSMLRWLLPRTIEARVDFCQRVR